MVIIIVWCLTKKILTFVVSGPVASFAFNMPRIFLDFLYPPKALWEISHYFLQHFTDTLTTKMCLKPIETHS